MVAPAIDRVATAGIPRFKRNVAGTGRHRADEQRRAAFLHAVCIMMSARWLRETWLKGSSKDLRNNRSVTSPRMEAGAKTW